MKRTKKITRKPNLAEKSSDGSDSDEKHTQPIKKGKGIKTVKMPQPPKHLDSDEPLPSKTKPKVKKRTAKLSKPTEDSSHNSDSEEKPQIKRKRKIKQAIDTIGPKEDSSDDSGSEEKPQIKRKVKNNKASNKKESKEELPDHSDAEEKKLQLKRKGTNKKAPGKLETRELSSNSDSEKKSRIKKKAKIRSTSKEEPSDHSDSEESPSHSSNAIGKDKKPNGTSDMAGSSTDQSEREDNLGSKAKPAEENNALSSDMELDSEAYFNPVLHEQSLRNLKAIDPDFFNYLKEHDAELLNFEADDDALEEKEGDDDFEKINNDDIVHVPGELHENSDESDFEMEDEKPVKGKVTLKMVKELHAQLATKGETKASTIMSAVKLFHAAVQRVTSEDGTSEGEFTVQGSSVFNTVLSMCVINLPKALRWYLGMEDSATNPSKCKHFVKIKGAMIHYLEDVIKLFSVITSDSILSIMLKHLHQMSSFLACFPRLAKKTIKKLLPLWTTGDETIRVLSFICILRITTSNQKQLLELVLKAMYLTYVKNCKFVSPTTWPGINFMRRSLAEMYMLDLDVSYQHVFLYIRQLGIHLRNAIMVPKLEHKLAVCNWQYLNSLHLWAELIQQTVHHKGMESLHFPLSMVISNTIKLVPTPQYYPVRFYLTEVLMDMTKESGLFIPILGFLMEVLVKFDFNKRQKKASMKPMDLSCIIRLSKSQMLENGFRDAVLERVYALVLEYTATLSSCMSFPEIVLFLNVQLKYLVSKSTVPHYAKKLKQLCDKIEESCKFMCKARVSCCKFIRDPDAIRAWEAQIRAQSTPLMTFYENWRKINQTQKPKVFNKKDELFGNTPVVHRKSILEDAKTVFYRDPLTPLNILPSDSEDEKDYFKNDDEEKSPPKEKRKKKKANIKSSKEEVELPEAADAGDIVKEFSASDW